MLTEVKERQLPPRRKTPFVSTNLTVEAHQAWTQATLNYSARAGRRITQSAVLLAALRIAERYPEEFAELLNIAPADEGTEEGETE
jgi:hypothetical protein